MYTVYALVDPYTNEIRYIGITKDVRKRYAEHLNRPHSNTAKNAWIDEIKASGAVPALTILESNIDSLDIFNREKCWIDHYLALGAPLTNIIGVPFAKKSGKYTVEQSGEYTVKELAQMFRVSEKTIFNLMKNGDLKAFKSAREWHFTEANIQDYEAQQRRKAMEA